MVINQCLAQSLINLRSLGFLTLAMLMSPCVGINVVRADDDDEVVEAEAPFEIPSRGALVTLDAYLDNVRGKHDDFRAAKKSHEAAKLSAKESQIAFGPYLYGNSQYTADRKPNLLFRYYEIDTTTLQLGVSQTTRFGLMGKAYYSLTDTAYHGLQFPGVAPDLYGYQGSGNLELTFSLWRNFLGGESSLTVEQGEATVSADTWNQTYQMKSVLVTAETNYWKLDLARASVKVAEDSVSRAQQLYEYNLRRSKSGLADRADLLQAEAALQQRRVELRTAQDNEVTASRAFNAMRGVNSPIVEETLRHLSPTEADTLVMPIRQPVRDDVKAAELQVKATTAGAELSRQKYLPTFEVFGTFASNTTNPYVSDNFIGNSFNTSRPTETVGVRLNAPLDFGLTADAREAWEAKKRAAEYTYQRKLLDQETAWNDLSTRFSQTKARLSLYVTLVKAQWAKLAYERERRLKGRTTTQQVINFESDFQNAQLSNIQTQSDLLQIVAQMKLFGDSHGLR